MTGDVRAHGEVLRTIGIVVYTTAAVVLVVVIITVALTRSGRSGPGANDQIGADGARGASHHAQAVRDQGFDL